MKTRKELKAEYKEKKFPIGVFQIRNLETGKIFLGSSLNLDAIRNRHLFQLNMGSHRNKALQADWNTYGESKFAFEIIEKIEQKDGDGLDYSKEIQALEGMYFEGIQPFGEQGYNSIPKN